MMLFRRTSSCVVIASMLVLAGCAGPHELPVAPTPIPTLAPATLPAVTPVAPTGEGETAGAVATGQGAEIFNANCAGCHSLGAEAVVGPGLAGLFQDSLPTGKPRHEANLVEWIQDGGGSMPGVAGIEGEAMDQLLLFLKQETEASVAAPEGSETTSPGEVPPGGETPPPTPPSSASVTPGGTRDSGVRYTPTVKATRAGATEQVERDPALVAKGKEVFEVQCAVCHALTGERKVGPGLAGLFSKELPDGRPATGENLADWIHTGGGAMPGFPSIVGEEMEGLLAYLEEATANP